MLIGSKQDFAIELDIVNFIDDWVLGRFIYWIDGIAVGNPDDQSVDLKGCINWLRDFLKNQRNRFEPGLFELDKEQIYVQLCSSVLMGVENLFAEEKYEDTFYRFHISHIGMSSFDAVTMVLIEDEHERIRCIWKQEGKKTQDALLNKYEMYKVINDVILNFDNVLSTRVRLLDP